MAPDVTSDAPDNSADTSSRRDPHDVPPDPSDTGIHRPDTTSDVAPDTDRSGDAGEVGTVRPGFAESDAEFRHVAAARHHTCAVETSGRVVCWGRNTKDQSDPPQGTFQQIAGGHQSSCGLMNDKTVTCWGGSGVPSGAWQPGETFRHISVGVHDVCGITTSGELKCSTHVGDSSPLAAGKVEHVDMGRPYNCAITEAGELACWGSTRDPEPLPTGPFQHVSVGMEHGCAVRTNGDVTCWGEDRNGEASPPSGSFETVSAGHRHTCGLRSDGRIECWGSNGFGQATPPPGKFSQISAGRHHTCGVTRAGRVDCWGSDEWGQTHPPFGSYRQIDLGVVLCGITTAGRARCGKRRRARERWAPPDRRFRQLSVNRNTACAVTTRGGVACWGSELTSLDSPGRFSQVSVGGHLRLCAITKDGKIGCWLQGIYEEVSSPERYRDVSLSFDASCRITTTGSLECVDYVSDEVTEPIQGQFKAVSGTRCALTTDGEARCWGRDLHGRTNAPSATFTQIDSGSLTACGVTEANDIECWGLGSDPDRRQDVSPHYGQGLPPDGEYRQVVTYDHSTCAIMTNDKIKCWGAYGFRL